MHFYNQTIKYSGMNENREVLHINNYRCFYSPIYKGFLFPGSESYYIDLLKVFTSPCTITFSRSFFH